MLLNTGHSCWSETPIWHLKSSNATKLLRLTRWTQRSGYRTPTVCGKKRQLNRQTDACVIICMCPLQNMGAVGACRQTDEIFADENKALPVWGGQLEQAASWSSHQPRPGSTRKMNTRWRARLSRASSILITEAAFTKTSKWIQEKGRRFCLSEGERCGFTLHQQVLSSFKNRTGSPFT